MSAKKIICVCNHVTEREIEGLLKKHPSFTLDDIKLATGASTNCGRCAAELKWFIDMKISGIKERQLKLF
jgi:bacterioferritin-associated ferredoxin